MESARTFTIRLVDLLARERAALGEFLVALAEFDARRLWMDLGYASLFDFLHRELGLSKASASFRKKAAELIQRFPEVAEALRDGRLCLTSVFELAKVLTPENREEVLPRFFQLSRREAKTVAAALRPQEAPPRREVVTSLRAPDVTPTSVPPVARVSNAARASAGADDRTSLESVASAALPDELLSGRLVCPVKPARANQAPTPQQRPALARSVSAPETSCDPLTGDLNRLHVTVSRRFLEKLEAARAALSHSHPGASADEILETGLDLLLERHANRRGLVQKPRLDPAPAKPEHVAAHVRRAVWERDGGRCQWPLGSGGICGSTLRVELDHRLASARGGPPTIENLRLLCRRHNDLAARRVFGDAWMDRFTRRRGGTGDVPSSPPV